MYLLLLLFFLFLVCRNYLSARKSSKIHERLRLNLQFSSSLSFFLFFFSMMLYNETTFFSKCCICNASEGRTTHGVSFRLTCLTVLCRITCLPDALTTAKSAPKMHVVLLYAVKKAFSFNLSCVLILLKTPLNEQVPLYLSYS